jgi:hypothetical protein
MPKIPTDARRNHESTLKLLEQETLTRDERVFMQKNYRPDADHDVGICGAHFTPFGMARTFVQCSALRDKLRVLDLCAGIGGLAFHVLDMGYQLEMVCVEQNAAFVDVERCLVSAHDSRFLSYRNKQLGALVK